MSANKQVIGQEKFDGFVDALKHFDAQYAISDTNEQYFSSIWDYEGTPFRKVQYIGPNGLSYVAEEYLAYITQDCNANDYLDLLHYFVGNRPETPKPISMDEERNENA